MIRYLGVLLYLMPCALFCQTGSIRGHVTDARSGEPLVGARVIIVGSKPGKGAASDLNGMFLIRMLAPGEYAVKIAYVDYQTVTRTVTVSPDQTAEISIAMRKEGDTGPDARNACDTSVVIPSDNVTGETGSLKQEGDPGKKEE